MAVENAKAPCRQDEEPRSWKEDAHDGNREIALLTVKSRRNQGDEQRGRYDAEEHEPCRYERKQRTNSAGHTPGLYPFVACDKGGVHGNERRRQRAFPEQILKKIGNAERRHKGVGRIGQPEVSSEKSLSDETGEAAAENAEGDERGMTIHGVYASPQPRNDAKNLFERLICASRGRGEA